MTTLYIDVYFLINFVTDTLAIYFSVKLIKATPTKARLVLGGVIGALFAVATVLMEQDPVFYVLMLASSAVLIVVVCCPKLSFVRRVKFFFSFILIETLLGGIVVYLYDLMDKYIYPLVSDMQFGAENRKILILSVVVLLAIAILKLASVVFSGQSAEKSVDFSFSAFGYTFTTSGLIDSGNLLKDPMDLSAVIIVKRRVIKKILGSDDLLIAAEKNERIRSAIRVIPAKGIAEERLLIGFKADVVFTVNKKDVKTDRIVIAIDEEEGSFSGYDALVPSEALSL